MFKLNPKQAEVAALLAGPQRHTLLVGGSRSGKTFLIVRMILLRAIGAPGSRHAMLRFRGNAAVSSLALDTVPKVAKLCYPQYTVTWKAQAGYFLIEEVGSEIWVGGLDDKDRVEKILGQEHSTLFFNECSQIPFASVTTALTRLAQKVETVDPRTGERQPIKQRAFYDLNPTSFAHWTYTQFVAGKQFGSGAPLLTPANYRHAFINPIDNMANLDEEYLAEMAALPPRERARFFEGKYTAEFEGSLWNLDMIERARVSADELPDMARIVVAVDPSGCKGPEDKRSDEIGIVVCGKGRDGKGYVLEDLSGRYAPEAWARVAVNACNKWKADRILGERNYGGDMVRSNIHAVDKNAPYGEVVASRGKVIRAEPIAALYEMDKIRHAVVKGSEINLRRMEGQLTSFTMAGYMGERSPDRADAMIHGMTSLMVAGGEIAANPLIIWTLPKTDSVKNLGRH